MRRYAAADKRLVLSADLKLYCGYQGIYWQGTNEVIYYSGFEMANNCGLIAVNGETEDPNQVCPYNLGFIRWRANMIVVDVQWRLQPWCQCNLQRRKVSGRLHVGYIISRHELTYL